MTLGMTPMTQGVRNHVLHSLHGFEFQDGLCRQTKRWRKMVHWNAVLMTAWGMQQLLKHLAALHSRQEGKIALERITVSHPWKKTTYHFYLSISGFDMYGYGYVTYFHAVCVMVNTWSWNTGTRRRHVQLRSLLGIKAVSCPHFYDLAVALRCNSVKAF